MKKALIARDKYLAELFLFRDTDLIKVVTGVRRCGKSSLLALAQQTLEATCASSCGFITLNLESNTCPIKTSDDLYTHCKSHLSSTGKTYIFIDEPQRIQDWQHAVNAMRVDFDCDLYITGSNAYLLSSELSTYLSGRYVEIKMLPLSFAEYCSFCDVSFISKSSIAQGPDDYIGTFDDIFERYLTFGGMPALASLTTNQAMHSSYIAGIYDAVASRDIINRERVRSQSKVSDPILLRKITDFLADNIGKPTAATRIANTLTSSGTKTTNKTIASYIDALNDAYLYYPVRRYDLHGKDILKTQAKEYIVDLGLRSYLCGYRITDSGRVFENAVYLQLLYDGWQVHIGKIYNKEIDFVAIKDGKIRYIQAANEMLSEKTKERELLPLQSIHDAHEKLVVVRQGAYETDINGIQIVSAQDFFL